MNQVALTPEQSVHHIGDVPAHLVHSQPVRSSGHPGNLHLPRTQIYKKENDKSLQSSLGPDFHGEEIRGYDQLPVACEELFPGRLPIPLGRGFETVPFKDRRDSTASQLMPQMR